MHPTRSRTLLFFLILSATLTACEFKCSVGNTKDDNKTKPVVSSTRNQDGTLISNGIELKAEGLHVKKAGLIYENKEPVPDDNIIDVNRKIWMMMEIDTGWTVSNGRVYPGASEKIVTSNGQTVVSAGDIFDNYTETGVSPADARYISLAAIITRNDPSIKYFEVPFEVWDKKGTGRITGSFRFKIKQ